ncbi:hypothetical protein BC832DRAFT_537316 [Gaertneriomyces semiglobifer]|nr:hypothetical protein BC832DRAFT_537316 [Gaertneriomyces semiglobifer]
MLSGFHILCLSSRQYSDAAISRFGRNALQNMELEGLRQSVPSLHPIESQYCRSLATICRDTVLTLLDEVGILSCPLESLIVRDRAVRQLSQQEASDDADKLFGLFWSRIVLLIASWSYLLPVAVLPVVEVLLVRKELETVATEASWIRTILQLPDARHIE